MHSRRRQADPRKVSPTRSSRRGRANVLAAGVFWSLSGVITKSLPLDPLTIAFYRGLFAGLALLPFVPSGQRVLRPVMIPLGLVFGAMTGLYLSAVKITTAANAIYLQYTATFWVVPLGLIFLGERPDRRARKGIALAMIGIAVIVGWGYDGRPDEWKGIILGLASGLGFAVIATGMRGLRDLDPVWLSAIYNLLGSMALGAWIAMSGSPLGRPTAGQGMVLLVFGVIQMALPYMLFARGLREIGTSEAGLIALIEPILNPIWVILAVGERPAVPTLIGGLFLLSGVAYRYWPLPPAPASALEESG
ncbi:MAG: DMT family transporter [Isosphaeraceae bacterium]